jgi:hypothetical protein
MNDQSLEANALRKKAETLAGKVGDLVQRSSVYHHLYSHSGQNHSFPLLAAHGALWASGYFKQGMQFGSLVAAFKGLQGHDRLALIASLQSFADDFRDINRRVCVETYFIYHLTAQTENFDIASTWMPESLLVEMDRCHCARRSGRSLSNNERRSLFMAFFLWEQEHIVGPAIETAYAKFGWSLIRSLALKPRIRFAYFDKWSPLAFKNFADTSERIEMGVRAFDRACLAGWQKVENALFDYEIMPKLFEANAEEYFRTKIETLAQPHMATA